MSYQLMDKAIRWTILIIIAGVILAFNMYHADYKLLVAQVGTIALVAMFVIARRPLRSLLAMTLRNPAIWLLGICVISFLMSPHKIASGQELYKVGTWVVFGLIVGKVLSAADFQLSANRLLKNIINVWLICAGIVVIYEMLQFFGIDFMKFKLAGGRIVSTFGNATLLAGFLAMTVPVALVKTFERKRAISYQLSAISLLIVLLVCLVLTKSRAGILAAMVGILTIYILRAKSRSSRLVPSGLARTVLAGIILAGIALLLIPQAQHVIFDVILRRTARVYLWKDALQMIRIHPIFGAGIGTFGLYFSQFVTQRVLEMHPVGWEFVNHVHCEYLEILSEMGIVGLVAFLAVVGAVIYGFVADMRARKNNGLTHIGLFAALVTILAHNIISVDLRYTSTGLFFWMLVGMVIAESRGKNKAVSFQPSAIRFGRSVFNMIIIIAAITAIYFTVRPYIDIQKVKEQEFFTKDIKNLESKIERIKVETHKDADYFFNLGVLYAKKQDFQKAKEYFVKTIRQDYKHAGAFNNLGNIAGVDGDFGRARALFHKAVRAEPDNVDYLINFASACFKVNVMDEAMEGVEKALSIDPDNSRALLLRRQMTQ